MKPEFEDHTHLKHLTGYKTLTKQQTRKKILSVKAPNNNGKRAMCFKLNNTLAATGKTC